MNVYEVIVETTHNGEVITDVTYVTTPDDSLAKVAAFYECDSHAYDVQLKSVRYLLTIPHHIP